MLPDGRYRRALALLLTLLVLLPALVACGGGGGDDETTPAANGTGTMGSAATQASGSTPSSGNTPAAGQTPAAGSTPTSANNIPTMLPSTPQPTRSSTVDHREGDFAYGWNVAMRGDETGADHNTKTANAVVDSGFGWVRFQVEWRGFEPANDQWDPIGVDRIVEQLHGAGLNILIVVAKAPDWATAGDTDAFLADYTEFQELMGFLADRYKGKVQAWEIWNEQNLAHEMGGHVNVTDYFDLLQAGSAGVRSGDPDAKVVFGGLTPNGINDPAIAIDDQLYLQLIYQYRGGEVKNYFDILGVHLNSTHNPPDTLWPDNPSTEEGWNDDESFYFRRAEQLRQVMLAAGDDAKPVWITEFGWTTENQAPGYEYGVNNTEDEVAEYLTRALEIARDDWDFVTGAFVWNLNWSTLANEEDEKYPWSALNGDWSPRPAYDALKAFDKS